MFNVLKAATLSMAVLLPIATLATAQTPPSTPPAATKPAGLAVSNADCAANFNSADADKDGKLSKDEVTNSKSLIPTTLLTSATINQQDFLQACSVTVLGKQN